MKKAKLGMLMLKDIKKSKSAAKKDMSKMEAKSAAKMSGKLRGAKSGELQGKFSRAEADTQADMVKGISPSRSSVIMDKSRGPYDYSKPMSENMDRMMPSAKSAAKPSSKDIIKEAIIRYKKKKK